MAENSEHLGELFRQKLSSASLDRLESVRGKGLMNALVLKEDASFTASEFTLRLKEAGVLCKPTHGNVVRVTPPLCINRDQLIECTEIIEHCIATD